MSIIVNPHSPQEEQQLIAFLDSMKFEYSTERYIDDISDIQKAEILRREADFKAGKIKSQPWSEVRKRFSL
jgi:putative addiction module component (TIGR02574 family)